MSRFWKEKKYQIIGAGLGILFHSLVLLIVSGGKGQVGILLVLFDFPIHLLGRLFLIQSDLVLWGIGGTLMYAIVGWTIGAIIKRKTKALESTKK